MNMKADKAKIDIAMARRCINTYDLAKIANMPIPTMNNVLKGKPIKPATIGKLARALEVDVTELIED